MKLIIGLYMVISIVPIFGQGVIETEILEITQSDGTQTGILNTSSNSDDFFIGSFNSVDIQSLFGSIKLRSGFSLDNTVIEIDNGELRLPSINDTPIRLPSLLIIYPDGKVSSHNVRTNKLNNNKQIVPVGIDINGNLGVMNSGFDRFYIGDERTHFIDLPHGAFLDSLTIHHNSSQISSADIEITIEASGGLLNYGSQQWTVPNFTIQLGDPGFVTKPLLQTIGTVQPWDNTSSAPQLLVTTSLSGDWIKSIIIHYQY